MKPRTLRTYKILAVALTAAGCTSAAGPEPRMEAGADPANPVAQAPTAPAPPEAQPPPTAIAMAAPGPRDDNPALDPLREELSEAGHDRAFAALAHYRPLCDAQGYPLVGNLFRKSPFPQYQPTAFCADVRKAGKR